MTFAAGRPWGRSCYDGDGRMFVIIWGSNPNLRHVADTAFVCPVCRTLTACRLFSTQLTHHVYFIPVSTGPLTWIAICKRCRVEVLYDLPLQPLPSTAEEARETFAERLDLERRVRAGEGAPEERQALIDEAFTVFRALARESVYFGSWYWVVMAASAVSVVGLVLARRLPGPLPLVTFVACFLATFNGVAAACRMFKRHETRDLVEPRIAQALLPLRPNDEELRHGHAELRRLDPYVGRTIRPAAIRRDIERTLNKKQA
jgi:hypothetical protein